MKKDKVIIAERGGTLLEYLREALPQTPHGKIKSYLTHRQISVEGEVTTRYDFPVTAGAIIKISESGGSVPTRGIEIIYEDDFLLAVNKPAGLLAVSTEREKIKTAYARLSENRRGEIFVVHRLDRDTSGVLLFAKSREIKEKLQANWNEAVFLREYFAICEGIFDKKRGKCDTCLSENSAHVVYSDFRGKRAVTNYEVVSENGEYSLVRILLETGRKNQIRVHMKELSHPVVGDRKYGSESNPIGRLGLHAEKLGFVHPVSGKEVIITAKRDVKFRLPKK